ncbi:CDP-glycerol glycerophosphotransferase family protein [Pediococcus argentinicus]|uniref:CDP-glycerol poly(Glycerophosphate) glycerophosphotransferase n=1 Tax=Pediococcus argentinicus TaxID=480391 RepID=A0A0R2NKG6_9LACO|nr:CDP-glycerol glycerophosphotransferase family protein [Pediococcus argentinicus]KRO26255.1 CDP-glycerol poly(glycerophosphate) glycerophosphotransferase [Pediococcus argentinicus]NKZ21553.1 CDP-glycerol glycerophosphotransferase family protein [Pediococcus argentinicus]GEP18648.1 CDP-glycerol glycerophosphotransferase [Pediococcus argentinicus]
MSKITQSLKLVARHGLILVNNILIHFPVQEDQTLFESFNGNGFTDNPRAIYEELINSNPNLNGKLFWGAKGSVINQLQTTYPSINFVKRWSLKWIWLSATANYWIFNSRMPTWWKKNAKTKYVQTWHGTPLKHLALDMDEVEIPGQSAKDYKTEFKSEAHRWDYLIAPNQYSKDIFESAFDYHGSFLETGYPRNDFLVQNNNQSKRTEIVKQLFGSKYDEKRFIMYAPTWREDDAISTGKYHFQMPFNINNLVEQLPEDVVLLIRPHYLIADQIDVSEFNGRVLVDAQTDINQLYEISDAMITDYSSVMFDYAILNRPILFYAYDLEHYRDQLRGFYFDYFTELPSDYVTKESELLKQINTVVENGFKIVDLQRMERFRAKFASWENGTASRQVLKRIGLGEDAK